jgi:hypothetical protein
MSFLKKVKPDHFSVRAMIHERVAHKRKARSMHHIHASDVTRTGVEFCPREYALVDMLDLKRPDEFISTAMQITFDIGENTQYRINNVYLRDIMVGDWKCANCGEVRKFCRVPKDGCSNNFCNTHWEYQEVRAESEVSGISCGLDALIHVGAPKLHLIEIKSIDKDQYKALEAPLAEHRERTNLYLRCIAESPLRDYINTDVATVLYCSKAFGNKFEGHTMANGMKDAPFTPFKEYQIKAKPDSVQHLVDGARKVLLFRNGEGGMPSGVCKNALCKRAETCAARQHCFSGKYPAGD